MLLGMVDSLAAGLIYWLVWGLKDLLVSLAIHSSTYAVLGSGPPRISFSGGNLIGVGLVAAGLMLIGGVIGAAMHKTVPI
jgi:hypothetical protein